MTGHRPDRAAAPLADTHHVYVYATGREDGMRFAVGEYTPNQPVNGCIALFATAGDVDAFVWTWSDRTAGEVAVLPSAAAAGVQQRRPRWHSDLRHLGTAHR
jgi:hypothetical protein